MTRTVAARRWRRVCGSMVAEARVWWSGWRKGCSATGGARGCHGTPCWSPSAAGSSSRGGVVEGEDGLGERASVCSGKSSSRMDLGFSLDRSCSVGDMTSLTSSWGGARDEESWEAGTPVALGFSLDCSCSVGDMLSLTSTWGGARDEESWEAGTSVASISADCCSSLAGAAGQSAFLGLLTPFFRGWATVISARVSLSLTGSEPSLAAQWVSGLAVAASLLRSLEYCFVLEPVIAGGHDDGSAAPRCASSPCGIPVFPSPTAPSALLIPPDNTVRPWPL